MLHINCACTNLAARSRAVAAAALSALRWLARFDRRSIVRPPLKQTRSRSLVEERSRNASDLVFYAVTQRFVTVVEAVDMSSNLIVILNWQF